jgi:hypothetical protein
MVPNRRLQRRGGARLIPRMMPNTMTKRMFFLSHMHLFEEAAGGEALS